MGSTIYFCFKKTQDAGVMGDRIWMEQCMERLLMASEYNPGDLGVGCVS